MFPDMDVARQHMAARSAPFYLLCSHRRMKKVSLVLPQQAKKELMPACASEFPRLSEQHRASRRVRRSPGTGSEDAEEGAASVPYTEALYLQPPLIEWMEYLRLPGDRGLPEIPVWIPLSKFPDEPPAARPGRSRSPVGRRLGQRAEQADAAALGLEALENPAKMTL